MATYSALVILFSFLPSILLRPIGGVLADRFDRRLMMMIGDLGSMAGIVFILFAFMMPGEPKLWLIYSGLMLNSIFVALQNPAYKATATDLLTEDQCSKGSGLVQLAESSRFLLSPFLAGLIMYYFSIQAVLIINIVTYILAVFTVFLIKKQITSTPRAEISDHWLKELEDGWQAIVSNHGVFLLILMISLVTFFLGFLQTLIGPMVLTFSDTRTLGTIQSLSAIGMLISSLLLGMMSVGHRYVDIMVGGLVVAGIAFFLFGTTTNVYFITFAGILFMTALPFVHMSADVLIRTNIPNEKQGRVWGMIGILSQLGYIVAYGISGPLADFVFNPLLENNGLLVSSVGRLIGVGPGRGIGFMFVISGIFVVISALLLSRIQAVRTLNLSVHVNTGTDQ